MGFRGYWCCAVLLLAGCFVDQEGSEGSDSGSTTSETGAAETTGGSTATSAADGTTTATSSSSTSRGPGDSTGPGNADDTAGEADSSSTGRTVGCSEDAYILFVNFDGVTLTEGAEDATNDTTDNPQQAGEWPEYGGDDRDEIIEHMRDHWAPFNVCIVQERPRSGSYDSVVATGTTPFPTQPNVFSVGVPDCGNTQVQNVDVAFFPPEQLKLSPFRKAALITFVAGMQLGLDAVNGGSEELMTIFAIELSANAGFQDECFDHPPPRGCGGTTTCERDQQNSFAALEAQVGLAP